MEIGGVNVLVAFLAGMLSCISPCVLPLAPIYAGNLAGGTAAAGALDRRAPVLHAVAFMAGFVLFFSLLGVSVGLVGFALRDQLPLLQKAGGLFLVAMGLHMSRILELSVLYRGLGLDWSARARPGYLRSFLAGTSISVGWLPCIGPTMGVILTLAITSGTALLGGALLLIYSLGMAIPFVAFGVVLSRTPRMLRWMQRRHDAINVVAGIVMIVMGVVLFTGALQRLNGIFRFTSGGLAGGL